MASGGERGLPAAVLFVCTMNSVRSPMAASILRHLAGRRVYVESAGVRAGGADAFAVAAMEEIGIDITRHAPHTLRDLYDTSFDLIITLSPEAHHQAGRARLSVRRIGRARLRPGHVGGARAVTGLA